jgi:magnesium-transporting ATPase (P-type)
MSTAERSAATSSPPGPGAAAAEARPTPIWVTALAQFKSPLIFILLLAGALTFALGEYVDTAVIAAVLLLNAVHRPVPGAQRRTLRARADAAGQPHGARVVRDGHEWEIDSAEVVPGDLVVLESGVRVPADLRLVSAAALRIDESMLTGESVPASKGTDPVDEDAALGDRTCMAFTGSTRRHRPGPRRGGRHRTRHGARPDLRAARGRGGAHTPLQERMDRFGWIIGAIVVVAAG